MRQDRNYREFAKKAIEQGVAFVPDALRQGALSLNRIQKVPSDHSELKMTALGRKYV